VKTVDIIWDYFHVLKKRYEKTKKKIKSHKPTVPDNYRTICTKTAEELTENKASIQDWLEAQFFFFHLYFQKSPTINQLSGDRALRRYKDYMENSCQDIDISIPVEEMRFSNREVIERGQELLAKAVQLYPELTEVEIVRLFADQFPEEFLEWFLSRRDTVEDQVARLMKKRHG